MAKNYRNFGINLPLKRGQDGFYFETTKTEKDAVRSNLLHFILTKRGERLMKPNFGTDLYKFLFEPMDAKLLEDVETNIRESVEESFKGLKITKFTPTFADEKALNIEIEFSYNNGIFQESDILNIKL